MTDTQGTTALIAGQLLAADPKLSVMEAVKKAQAVVVAVVEWRP